MDGNKYAGLCLDYIKLVPEVCVYGNKYAGLCLDYIKFGTRGLCGR